jgi:hypothetical protein
MAMATAAAAVGEGGCGYGGKEETAVTALTEVTMGVVTGEEELVEESAVVMAAARAAARGEETAGVAREAVVMVAARAAVVKARAEAVRAAVVRARAEAVRAAAVARGGAAAPGKLRLCH